MERKLLGRMSITLDWDWRDYSSCARDVMPRMVTFESPDFGYLGTTKVALPSK